MTRMKRSHSSLDQADWHPIVGKMKARFDAVFSGQMPPYGSWEKFFPASCGTSRRADAADAIRCTQVTYGRCLRLANQVCLSAERAGFNVGMGYDCSRLQLVRDDAPVWLRIIERSKAGAAEELKDAKRAIRGRYGHVGTGQIELVLTQYGGGTSTFRDKHDQTLEQQIEEIVRAIERHHVGALALATQHRESTKQQEQREREREIQNAKRAEEKKRREELIRRASDFSQAQQIRALVLELRQRATEGSITTEEFEAWAVWALGVADEMDRDSAAGLVRTSDT